MGTIRAMRINVGKINLSNELPNIIQTTAKDIIKLNQNQLYFKSEDSLGFKLAPYKSKVYAAEKIFTNPNLPFGAPDLKLTGAFYRGFYVTFDSKNSFYVSSADDKSFELEKRYGKNIFGLNEENKTRYAKEVVYPKILEYIRRKANIG